MLRKIIEIDEEKCNGCGACIPNCPEGALQVIDGKARLVGDLLCDGLGACLGTCPRGAIRTVEREAEPYDERKAMDNLVPQGAATVAAHLNHLKSHGQHELYTVAAAYLAEHGIPLPAPEATAPHPHQCPGSMARRLAARPVGAVAGGASALRQWPVQLKLLNPAADYFDDADLLVCADCVAYASGAFHRDLLAGRIAAVFCPKLDSGLDQYVAKLAELFRTHRIKSVTVARMEVPCCGGVETIVQKALEAAGSKMEVKVKVVGIDGDIR